MSNLRKTLLLIFAAIYFIACPLLILYSFGRILRPGAGSSAGVIFLSSNPPGATIDVEGRRFSQRTPAALSGMLPGEHDITLSLEGYQPWQHKVRAFPKLASALDKILLLPEEWKTQELLSDSFRELIPIPLSRFLILTKGNSLGDYYSFDTKSKRLIPFLNSESKLASWEVVSFFNIDSSSRVVILARTFGEEKYLLIEQEKGYVNIKDISRFFPARPEHILWDARAPNHIFSFANNKLNKIDTLRQSLEIDYLEQLRGYGVFGRKLYVLKDINTLFRIDYDQGNQKVLINDPILGEFLFGREGFFQVKPLDNNLIVFLGEDGKLLSNRLPYRIAEAGVKGIEFHHQSKRVLFWMNNQAGIIDYRPLYSADPTIAKTVPTKGHWFYSKGGAITQAFWAYQGFYIILVDADKVFIFELKGETEASPSRVVKIKYGSSVHYLESSGKLYYLDPLTKRLKCIDIVDKTRKKPLSFKEYLAKFNQR